MTLVPVETPEDFLLVQQFIIPHEETCVTIASLVRRKTDKLVFLVDSDNPMVECSRSECIETTADIDKPVVSIRPSSYSTNIVGILNLDSTIYHCLPDISKIDKESLKENLPYLMKKPVRCISGETTATEFLIDVVNSINCSFNPSASPAQQPVVIYPYRMLRWLSSFDTSTSLSTLSGGEEIFRCTENDMEILHPLQKDYMKDEVAVPGRTITDAEVSITLRQILKNQLCLAMLCDGEPVAKANTNAIGINCVQIGGVYTHPLYRRNGYAGALVQALCNRAIQGNRKPVLFVKEKNTPAFNLYQKFGFEECGRYTIAYY